MRYLTRELRISPSKLGKRAWPEGSQCQGLAGHALASDSTKPVAAENYSRQTPQGKEAKGPSPSASELDIPVGMPTSRY
jgi:hypothetical protein